MPWIAGVGVELRHPRQEIALGDGCRQRYVLRVQPRVRARLDLVPDIDPRRSVVADLDRGESRANTGRDKPLDAGGQLGTQASGQSGAVDDPGFHGVAVLPWGEEVGRARKV